MHISHAESHDPAFSETIIDDGDFTASSGHWADVRMLSATVTVHGPGLVTDEVIWTSGAVA